jgi:transposase
MGLSHCRIKINHRRKLIGYVVMEVTARSAADVIGAHPNTAALFYHKLRAQIQWHTPQKLPLVSEGPCF